MRIVPAMTNPPLMTPDQCRAARALVGLTQGKLAKNSATAGKIVNGFEVRRGNVTPETVQRMQSYLERAYNVRFLFERRAARGVMLNNAQIVDIDEEHQELEPIHLRMARAWLGWSHTELAEQAGVAVSTIRDFEKGRHFPRETNLSKIELAIKSTGITFLFDADANPIGIWVLNGVAVVDTAKAA